MTECNVKGVTHSEEPAENYHQTLQLLSAFQLLPAYCLAVLFHSHRSHHHPFLQQIVAVLKILRIDCTLPDQRQTEKVKD